MVIEEIKFINDVIQDTRADVRIETKYEMLLNCIFKNVGLNWNNEGLTFKSTDDKVFHLLEVLEPERYQNALESLLKLEEDKKKE